jgi:N-acetylglucosaminyldiphosphoundecaprenol N-acetyl-beta-D-mannosaminyltransferase
MHPGLRIAGINSAWFEADGSSPAMDALVDELRRTRPDLVFVGIGSPKSERITERLRASVGAVMPSTWWIGVGISFSFISGQIPRAPHWMQRSGLEWVHRLWQEPRRLAKRYLVEGLPFALTLFARSWLRRWRPAAPHEE